MPKIIDRPQRVNAEVLGLDIHQGVIVFCRLDRRGRRVGKGKIPGGPASLTELLDRVVGRRRTHVAFEAGGEAHWVFDLLVERYGRERVHVAHPQHVRLIAKSTRKNDLSDAYWLAYLTREGRLPEAWIPDGLWRDLRLVSRERREATRRRTRAVNALRAHLRQMGERLPTVRVDTKSARAYLADLADRTPGPRGVILHHALERLRTEEAEIEQWTRSLVEVTRELPLARTLRREIPGAGEVLAGTIAAELGPVERFPSPKALARYTGLTPIDRSTGGRTIHGGITRQGNPDLRWALGQVVMACLRARRGRGLAVSRWTRAKARHLASDGTARVAAARKVSEAIWRCVHEPEGFDITKPFGGMPDVA